MATIISTEMSHKSTIALVIEVLKSTTLYWGRFFPRIIMLFLLTWRKFYAVQNCLYWANSALPSLQQSLLFYQRHLSSFSCVSKQLNQCCQLRYQWFSVFTSISVHCWIALPCLVKSTICRSDQKRRTTENNNKDKNLNY